MKTNLFKNKKVRIVLSIALAAVIITAGTFAWFSGTAGQGSAVTMGALEVNVTLDDGIDDDYYYEPGETADLKYTIDNIHPTDNYKAAMIKADFKAGTVVISSDDYGKPLAAPYTMNIDPATVDVIGEIKTFIDPITYEVAAWYVDRTTDIYYLLLDPGMAAVADLEVNFVGKTMGNAYQNAQFDFAGTFPYTQVMEEAMLDVLGLDVMNLDPIDEDGIVLYEFSLYSADGGMTRNDYMQLLYDAMAK